MHDLTLSFLIKMPLLNLLVKCQTWIWCHCFWCERGFIATNSSSPYSDLPPSNQQPMDW